MIRGNSVMKGYLKNPAATAEAFRGGYFHSGDIAVQHPDGYLQIADRAKDIIISGGENISSVEVEGVLIGLLGTAVGVGVGLVLVRWIITTTVAATMPEMGLDIVVSAGTVLTAVVLGVVALVLLLLEILVRAFAPRYNHGLGLRIVLFVVLLAQLNVVSEANFEMDFRAVAEMALDDADAARTSYDAFWTRAAPHLRHAAVLMLANDAYAPCAALRTARANRSGSSGTPSSCCTRPWSK